MTSRLATFRKERRHPQFEFAPARACLRELLRHRATDGGVLRGFWSSRSCSRTVSIAEVDERRAAHRARGRRVRGYDEGSSRPARERRGGEKAPEAGSAAQPGSRDRWRAPDGMVARPAHHPKRSTRRWKALWAVKTALFDEGAADVVLVPRGHLRFRPRAAAGRDRERQKPFASCEPGRERPPRSGGTREGVCPHLSRRRRRSDVSEAAEAGGAVKRIASRGWIAARRSGADEGARSIERSSRLLAVGAA